MAKPLIQIDDEVREMTDEEHASYKALQAESAALADAQKAKEAARESLIQKLSGLGFTDEEIAAL